MSFLLARTQSVWCALALEYVAEVARCRPVTAVASAPDFVLGVVALRDEMVPVIDLGRLVFGEALPAQLATPAQPAQPVSLARWVRLRAGAQCAALRVDEVAGVVALSPETLAPFPALLAGAEPDRIRALGQRDSQVLAVLETARIATAWKLEADGSQGAVS